MSDESDEVALSAEALRAILDTAGDGIVALDADGRTSYLNPAAQRILGITPVVGSPAARERPYRVFLPDQPDVPFAEEDRPIPRTLRGLDTDDLEMLVRGPGGVFERYVRITARPMRDAAGAVTGCVVSVRETTALRAARVSAQSTARTDPLTGLSDRRALDERIAQLVLEAGRGRRFAVLMADIDHFKRINDTHGHPVGDEVLKQLARVIESSVRATDFIARLGGEEFCVLLTDVNEDEAVLVAEKLRVAVAGDASDAPSITISIGVAANDGELQRADALLAAADVALYRAKAAGRDRVVRASALPKPPTNEGAYMS